MNNNVAYWIWLQSALGYASRITPFLNYFETPKNFYEASEADLRNSGLFEIDLLNPTSQKLKNVLQTSLDIAYNVRLYCKNHSIKIVTPDDSDYPSSLKALKTMPAVLYYRGDISCLNEDKNFAVIGTRRPSEEGKKFCVQMSEFLSKNDCVIVSGGALGIDSLAHKTAIELEKKTVLVMGTGLDSNYLPQNDLLREYVSSYGAVVTEYQPKTQGTLYSFPRRNRITVALSKGIVAIRAGVKSGTLDACSRAKKRLKTIFAFKPTDSVGFEGNEKLIGEGAFAISEPRDVFEVLNLSYKTSENYDTLDYKQIENKFNGNVFVQRTKRTEKQPSRSKINSGKPIVETSKNTEKTINPDEYSADVVSVFNAIKSGILNTNDISKSTGIGVYAVLTALTELEIDGLVKKNSNGNYEII